MKNHQANGKVSVIITTHNRASYLSETLESVLNQDYDNMEVIVVDDNSNDDTQKILSSYENKYVKCFSHDTNLGKQAAAMTGFYESSGEYVYFLDDDDIWDSKNNITARVKLFEQDKQKRYGIVASSVKEFQDSQCGAGQIKPKKWPSRLVRHLMARNGVIYQSAAMLRTEAFVQSGAIDANLVKGIDSDIFRRIVLNGWDVNFISEPKVLYRVGHDRMSSMNEAGIRRTISAQLRLLEKYSSMYLIYKREKKARSYNLARSYKMLYDRTGSSTAKENSKIFFRESLGVSFLGVRALVFMFYLTFKK